MMRFHPRQLHILLNIYKQLRRLRLEAEDLVLELADWLSLCVAQALSRLLHRSNHRRRTANQNLDVAGRRRQLLLDHIRSDESNAAGPALWRVVEHVVYPELGVLCCKRIEILLEQNVLGVYVCEDEIDLGSVALAAAPDNSLDDLQHGSDAGAA
ncbi:hypothetical protein HBI81_028140 [Parastagonospora nodorum]|nr:hypothetical protein HBH50_117100 [Parastagonospora nodorum]KAH4100267.1 hypothetical protein HBH48_018640 [Parastagonospora nodorum]KAH4390046.1 hypothetical protein HBH97_047100 [Parastagonospora nodorum]KAH4414796.1 hypothetical protein HBH99_065920 [Parastagonospora nodorum]KAH4422774.1 hypothetical protein HBH92_019010 [Parastagonospora nodorum]